MLIGIAENNTTQRTHFNLARNSSGKERDVAVHISSIRFWVRPIFSFLLLSSFKFQASLDLLATKTKTCKSYKPHKSFWISKSYLWCLCVFFWWLIVSSLMGLSCKDWFFFFLCEFWIAQRGNAWETANWASSGSVYMWLVLGAGHFSRWFLQGTCKLLSFFVVVILG